jgi:hypothetical protein
LKKISDIDPSKEIDKKLLQENESISGLEIMKELKKQDVTKNMLTKEISLKDIENVKEIKVDYLKEIENFKNLLKEKGIGRLSSFEKELFKLIYDERYNQLPQELRKQVFDEYVKHAFSLDKSESTRNQQLNRRQGQEKMKILLKRAIEKGDLNLNTNFADFSEKYQDDNLFTESLPIDREFLFNEAKLKLKKILEESNILFLTL